MRNMILGTDWWTDCDDTVALRMICRYVKDKKINLKGVIINACMEYSVASLKGFLKAEGINEVPVGVDLEADDFGGNPPYQKRLMEKYCPEIKNEDAENAVKLYRRLLSEADEPVEIMEIGFLQVVAALLKSVKDEISDKSGLELVKEKVKKFWVMAGKWDKDGETENNFCRNERSRKAAEEFCGLCPVPVTFLGWEVGYDVISGDKLNENDHLYDVLCDHGSKNGRSSWDPMLVLMALTGDEEKAGYKTVIGKAIVDSDTGANHFEINEKGLHKYVIKNKENSFYEDMINEIIK